MKEKLKQPIKDEEDEEVAEGEDEFDDGDEDSYKENSYSDYD